MGKKNIQFYSATKSARKTLLIILWPCRLQINILFHKKHTHAYLHYYERQQIRICLLKLIWHALDEHFLHIVFNLPSIFLQSYWMSRRKFNLYLGPSLPAKTIALVIAIMNNLESSASRGFGEEVWITSLIALALQILENFDFSASLSAAFPPFKS